ncbi:unnamed protein product [Prorocentrum cordatum]|uniref:Uncharacterized protein n=1 Tax=Prorocentrum cordatum TaxID=2364126 RepID=A0ABN9W8L3_9DINO|nr:unnamed protein product [Polarella glacialis]CAK0904797.1 unnamed protein product [Polarella glacialis]
MNIDLNPLGNAFYAVPECNNAKTGNESVPACGGAGGYDAGMRKCFNQRCGPGVAVADRSENCYRGSLIFQHGFKEAWFTRYFACAKHASSTKNWENYGQFVLCMERNYTTTEGGDLFETLIETCAESSNINFAEIDKCYKSGGGEEAFELEARNIPEHDGVPWIIVNGVVQPESYDENALLTAVQDAMGNSSKLLDAPRLAAIQQDHELLGARREERRRHITC